jgi:hypothetical protein
VREREREKERKKRRERKRERDVLIKRIFIQHEIYSWLKHTLAAEAVHEQALKDVVELGMSHYSNVR